MMFKRWNNTAYSGTHTDTLTHAQQKTTGCNYRHTGSGRDVYSKIDKNTHAFANACFCWVSISDLQPKQIGHCWNNIQPNRINMTNMQHVHVRVSFWWQRVTDGPT